jgi:hypothetical protein
MAEGEGAAAYVDHARREAVTMALYLGVVLGAEVLVIDDHVDRRLAALGIIWGSTLGLTLAHIFAFDLSSRLFSGGIVDAEAARSIGLQLGTAVAVALALSVPFLFLDTDSALAVDAYLIVLFIGATAFAVARAGRLERWRALGFTGVVVAIAAAVVGIKIAVSGY